METPILQIILAPSPPSPPPPSPLPPTLFRVLSTCNVHFLISLKIFLHSLASARGCAIAHTSTSMSMSCSDDDDILVRRQEFVPDSQTPTVSQSPTAPSLRHCHWPSTWQCFNLQPDSIIHLHHSSSMPLSISSVSSESESMIVVVIDRTIIHLPLLLSRRRQCHLVHLPRLCLTQPTQPRVECGLGWLR